NGVLKKVHIFQFKAKVLKKNELTPKKGDKFGEWYKNSRDTPENESGVSLTIIWFGSCPADVDRGPDAIQAG
ncbi:MAG: hypothetical protein K2I48_07890, partial [Muribaculaceae bacterium]|nr:hypothetical protein [Muribaculaceae bacterium]